MPSGAVTPAILRRHSGCGGERQRIRPACRDPPAGDRGGRHCRGVHAPDQVRRPLRHLSRRQAGIRQGHSGQRSAHHTPAIHAEIMKHAAGKEAQVPALELALWEQCSFCHVLKVTDNALPEVAPPTLKTRWFEHANFSHAVHSSFTCQGCHTAAATSTKASDILLPGLAKCESCHRPKGARSGCYECHSYHDWTKRQPVQTPVNISGGEGTTTTPGKREAIEMVAATR